MATVRIRRLRRQTADAAATTLELRDRLAGLGLDLPVRLWNSVEAGPADAGFRVVLHHPWSLRSLLWPPGDLSVGEAYVYGDVDVDGDLVAAVTALSAVDLQPGPLAHRLPIVRSLLSLPAPPPRRSSRRARLHGRAHSLERDRAAVQFHYDLGNEFFRTFLDDDLVYSCAYFTEDDDDLNRAQRRKLDLVCRKLRLTPGERLLDVGCGWGSLVIHAARYYGVLAVGITLSEQQAGLARERVATAGLEGRVDIRLEDYRQVEGSYEAVASVGMFEHVGARLLPTYFRRMYELTADGGRFLNHGITTGRRLQARDFSMDRRSFVGAYVFPDGALVPASTAVAEMEQAGFELVDVEQLRPHYERTLRTWVARLERNRDAAVAASSEIDYRIWRAYMSGSAVGFAAGDLGVVQVLGARGAVLPPGRGWMQPEGADVHPAA